MMAMAVLLLLPTYGIAIIAASRAAGKADSNWRRFFMLYQAAVSEVLN
jgi:hypothetical protein